MLDPFDPFLQSNRPRAPKRWRTLEDYLRPGMPLLLVYPDVDLTLSPETRADLTSYARRRPARAFIRLPLESDLTTFVSLALCSPLFDIGIRQRLDLGGPRPGCWVFDLVRMKGEGHA